MSYLPHFIVAIRRTARRRQMKLEKQKAKLEESAVTPRERP
jgi:hypothetical protein